MYGPTIMPIAPRRGPSELAQYALDEWDSDPSLILKDSKRVQEKEMRAEEEKKAEEEVDFPRKNIWSSLWKRSEVTDRR